MAAPDAAEAVSSDRRMQRLQRRRRTLQAAFFLLFLVAPALDLLRFDLHEAQLWFLGQRWTLGIDAFRAGQATAAETAVNLLLRSFVPGIALIVAFLGIAWRYGRLYCGWLCPHFSMVEALNGLLQRAAGKLSLWEPARALPDGRAPDARWWPAFALACVIAGFVWAITLVTYLLPPAEIWGGLLHATLTPNQARFLFIAWGVFALEFAFARHLFCRFGCAVGLFQSLAWMANPRGMVVAFSRERARECRSCAPPQGSARRAASGAQDAPDPSPGVDRRAGADPRPGSACDAACPMRLHPRNIKRMMFSCVQCGRCLDACEQSQQSQARTPVLQWQVGLDAVRETLRQRRAEQAARDGTPRP